jgi:hypothetical protein
MHLRIYEVDVPIHDTTDPDRHGDHTGPTSCTASAKELTPPAHRDRGEPTARTPETRSSVPGGAALSAYTLNWPTRVRFKDHRVVDHGGVVRRHGLTGPEWEA